MEWQLNVIIWYHHIAEVRGHIEEVRGESGVGLIISRQMRNTLEHLIGSQYQTALSWHASAVMLIGTSQSCNATSRPKTLNALVKTSYIRI